MSLKRTRTMTKDEAATIVSRAVKRARTLPSLKSRFRIKNRNNARIFPPKLRQTLVYSESYQITTNNYAAAPPTFNTFRLNGLFDPRAAIGGHQPMGFDQLMAIYTKFVVVGAKITVSFTASEAAYYTGDCGINIQDPGASAPISSEHLIESQYSTYGTYVQSGGSTTRTLALDMSRYFSVKDLLDEDDLKGNVSADPFRQVYALVWANNHTSSSHPVHITLKIEYDAVFLEPRETLES